MSEDQAGGVSATSARLFVTDIQQALSFLEAAFGASAIERQQDPAGDLVHAKALLGTSVLVLDKARGGRAELGCELYVWTDNVESTLRKAVQAGASVIEGVTAHPDGAREAAVRDSSGVTWRLNQPAAKPSNREIERRLKQQRKARL